MRSRVCRCHVLSDKSAHRYADDSEPWMRLHRPWRRWPRSSIAYACALEGERPESRWSQKTIMRSLLPDRRLWSSGWCICDGC